MGAMFGIGGSQHIHINVRKGTKKKRPENFSGLSNWLHTAGVAGSNPASPTIHIKGLADKANLFLFNLRFCASDVRQEWRCGEMCPILFVNICPRAEWVSY
jgi:hypothetical protein